VGDGRGVGVASGVPGLGYADGERSDSIETLGSFRIVGSDARRPSGEAVGSCATANGAMAAMIVSRESNLVFIGVGCRLLLRQHCSGLTGEAKGFQSPRRGPESDFFER
jgi:hypothetical protein